MNLDGINRWLTLGANIGVVVGLALLVFELRQNSELVRAQIHQARTDSYVADRQALADSEFLLPAYVKMMEAGDYRDPATLAVLDATERERIRRYFQSRFADYDNLFYQYRLGYLDASYYESRVVNSIRNLTPIWTEFDMIDNGTTEFAAEIRRITAEE